MLRTLPIALALSCAIAFAADAPPAPPAPKPTPQWVYVLKLVPRLHDDKAWTKADESAVGDHFRRLKQLTAERTVILAGRTKEPGDQTFGLVVFEAADEQAARALMEADPAVQAGVMTATLHPYSVALLRAP